MILDNLDFTQIPQLLQYDKTSPLIFSSGLFLFLFFIFLIGYVSLIKLQRARIIYVILFSLFFYYKSSGLWFALLIFTATSDFIIARRINAQRSMIARKFLLALSVIINLGMLSYFKYFNFLIEIFIYIVDSAKSFVDASYVPVAAPDAYDIFLPVGISFFTFQSMSYVIDVYRKHIPLLNNWFDYLFYVSFFPQLVAGPIVRAKEFIPQIYKPVHIDKVLMGEALFLIICGLFKKVVISDYISLNFVDRIFDAPLLYSGFENLLGIYGYALQIYCDFSGTLFGIQLLEVDWPWITSLKAFMMDSSKLFYFSLGVGVFQIMFGMVLKAVGQTQRFGFKEAIPAWGWLILLGGCGTTFGLSKLGVFDDGVATILYYVFGITGALGIFIFNDVKRNPLINVGAGVWDSYNMASGLLGDVLSYVRLFALGISGSVLGLVFNDLAMKMSPDIPVVGFLVSLLILVFGHSINIFMSGLGAFVHPMRLTFVEFYKNAGFEGGGKKYNPFAKRVKKEN